MASDTSAANEPSKKKNKRVQKKSVYQALDKVFPNCGEKYRGVF